MGFSLQGVLLKQSEMSVAERRQIVHELSNDSRSAFQVLQGCTRQEILHILSTESGHQRKYIGFTKAKLIDILLKILSERTPETEIKDSPPSERKTEEKEEKIASDEEKDDLAPTNRNSKRRRKNRYPSRYVAKVASFSGAKELSADGVEASTKNLQEEEKEEATLLDHESLLSKGKNLKTDSRVSEIEKNSSKENQENLPIHEQTDERQDRPVNGENSENYAVGFKYYVKVIRQLECLGHIESSFRQKFLTWYSLRATSKEISIVNTYIDVFNDDATALAKQLIHSFSDSITISR